LKQKDGNHNVAYATNKLQTTCQYPSLRKSCLRSATKQDFFAPRIVTEQQYPAHKLLLFSAPTVFAQIIVTKPRQSGLMKLSY